MIIGVVIYFLLGISYAIYKVGGIPQPFKEEEVKLYKRTVVTWLFFYTVMWLFMSVACEIYAFNIRERGVNNARSDTERKATK